MEPYLSPNNISPIAGTAEEQTRSQSRNHCHRPIMSSGRSMSRRASPHSSPYPSTHPRPSLPQSDALRLEEQMYAGMQQYPARPGGISRGGAHFFGRHHQSMHEHGHLASLGDRPMLAASPSVFGPALHRRLLNGRSPPPETLRRYHLGLHDDRSLLRGHDHGSSPSDRTIELGLVGYGATAPSSTNPTPSRVRGQPPGEDSYSAEYGPLRQHEGAQLAARRPSIYGSSASASMADLPPRTLEESFLRHGAIPPSLPAGYTSDAPGIPTYGRYDSTHRSVHSYLPAGEGEEEEEEMPPLPPLPTARRKAQPRQEETQAFQGEDRHDRGARPLMRSNRPDPINIVPQELAMGHEMVHLPRPLGMASDSRYLTEFHCFLRSNLIEVFCATKEDMNGKILIVLRDRSLQIFMSSFLISTRRISLTEKQFSHLFFIHSLAPRRGRKKPVLLGQVGVRCMSCAVAARGSGATGKQNHGASYYPTTIGSIYNSVMLIQQRHFSECKSISTEARAEYSRLKQILGRSGAAKDYWEDSARKMGLIDTPEGIRHQPSSPSTSVSASNAGHASASLTSHARNDGIEPAQSLVRLGDKDLATEYAFFIMQQMSPCTFTENDRLGKRRSHRCGFPGIACVHCVDKNGSGRYFPSSIKTFADASKTINVLHNHILKCSGAPEAVKNQLQQLKEAHQAEKDGMKHGSQKQFFDLVWSRLHNTSGSPSSVVSTSPHTNPSVSGGSPDACSFGSYGDSTTASSSTLAVSPADTTAASFVVANPRKVDSPISDVALIMLEMKSPVVWAAESDQVQQVASI